MEFSDKPFQIPPTALPDCPPSSQPVLSFLLSLPCLIVFIYLFLLTLDRETLAEHIAVSFLLISMALSRASDIGWLHGKCRNCQLNWTFDPEDMDFMALGEGRGGFPKRELF